VAAGGGADEEEAGGGLEDEAGGAADEDAGGVEPPTYQTICQLTPDSVDIPWLVLPVVHW
jgi:hypothetical protein